MSTIETGGPVGGMSPRDYFAAKAMLAARKPDPQQ